jgi:hypothetical protein
MPAGKQRVEADWAVEIGSGLVRMEADWNGFIDLRRKPEQIDEIAEAAGRPILREVLLWLNDQESPVFTSKCDVWHLAAEEIDPVEFEASPETSRGGIACYIDVLARDPAGFTCFERHEAWVRTAALALRSAPGGNGRADWVLRAAVADGQEGYGITLYAAGCGADTPAADAAWGAVLRAATAITMRTAWASSSIG